MITIVDELAEVVKDNETEKTPETTTEENSGNSSDVSKDSTTGSGSEPVEETV